MTAWCILANPGSRFGNLRIGVVRTALCANLLASYRASVRLSVGRRRRRLY